MKLKTIVISAFALLTTIGAVGGSAYYLVKRSNSSYSTSSNRDEMFNNNISSNAIYAPIANGDELNGYGYNFLNGNYYSSSNTSSSFSNSSPITSTFKQNSFTSELKSVPNKEIIGNKFGFKIQRHSSSSVETLTTATAENNQEQQYTIKIVQTEESKKQGTLYFITQTNDNKISEMKEEITFKPGDELKIGVKYTDEQKQKDTKEKLTIRDLLVSGVNPNHFVKTQKGETDDTYIIKMPKVEEQKNQDGTNWLYGDKQQINVKATFIKESIGDNTKWTHGAYFGDLNGYVYKLSSDTKWSEVKDTIYKTFTNDEITNPIDIYIFLEGHTLTIDEQIKKDFVPSGWALHFHNNGTDSATDSKYGKILAGSDSTKSTVEVGGSLYMGRSVEFNLVHTTNGVRFLNSNELKGWIGIFSNNPNETK